MAKIIPINKAEAIFAPLFDDKIIQLNEFKLIEYGAEDGRFNKASIQMSKQLLSINHCLNFRMELLKVENLLFE